MPGVNAAETSVSQPRLSELANHVASVDGKITGEELRIRNSVNWPDYVFSEEYNLMSLDVLESSINQNGHLPGVPPASVVKEEGIMVGDMQKVMMEKIEELTLYIIDINKENKELRQQLNELQKEVEELCHHRKHS